MLIYEFPSSSLRCRAYLNLLRRSIESFDQMLYYPMELEPNTAYPIPAGTQYILLTVQKTDQKAYKLSPPTPVNVPAETKKRPFEERPRPCSKWFPNRSRVFIPPIIRPSVAPVLIARPSTTFTSPLPVIIPELQPPVKIPPVSPMQMPETVQIPVTLELMRTVFQLLLQITDQPVQLFLPDPPQPPVQILLPDPPVQLPPVIETLEPTLTNDSLKDQIIPSVFEDCLQQGILAPPAHTEEPQVLDTVPSLCDESNDLISFLDHFETG
ncbi:hypothetical protein TNCV_4244401 [Trichonephila clavipes]|nr:hypothetical protein TNCV_4244401 [Trichonephila clavipes]